MRGEFLNHILCKPESLWWPGFFKYRVHKYVFEKFGPPRKLWFRGWSPPLLRPGWVFTSIYDVCMNNNILLLAIETHSYNWREFVDISYSRAIISICMSSILFYIKNATKVIKLKIKSIRCWSSRGIKKNRSPQKHQTFPLFLLLKIHLTELKTDSI